MAEIVTPAATVPGAVSSALDCCPTCGTQLAGAAADRDLDASDRDDTAESRDRAAERRDRGADDRDALARRELRTVSDGERLAGDRVQSLADRDQSASARDQRSSDRDQHSADVNLAAGGDPLIHDRGVLAREQSGHDREAVTVLRDQIAADRQREESASREEILAFAKHDRADAASDREDAAADREGAAHDRASSELRAVETFEAMSDAFLTLDSEWRFTYLNPQTEVILHRRREELLGKNMWDEFPEAIGTGFEDEYRRALRDGVPVRFEEVYDPLGRTIEVRIYPVGDGLAVYFSDVTTERRHEGRLREAQRLEAIGRVTAAVAHDFNNLLAAVRGFAQLGQSASVDEKATGYFAQIDLAGQKAATLTGQLLAFARKQQLSPASLDLNEVVESLAPLLSQLTPTSIDLRLALSAGPVPVFADRSQLEQVVVNLVVNSRDAIATAGSITVRTTSERPDGAGSEAGQPSAWLEVADTGSGISPEVMPHIFDPFFSTKPPESGSGLGLATIYGIVCQSGGDIFVDSTPGNGTTVTIGLPAAAQ